MGRRATILGLACLGLLIALSGVRAAIVEPGRTDILISLVLCSGMTLATVYEARRIGRPLPGATPLAIFLTWPVSIPLCLVWSRGWKRGAPAAMAFVGSLALLYLVPYYATGYAVWGAVFF